MNFMITQGHMCMQFSKAVFVKLFGILLSNNTESVVLLQYCNGGDLADYLQSEFYYSSLFFHTVSVFNILHICTPHAVHMRCCKWVASSIEELGTSGRQAQWTECRGHEN